MKLQLQIVLLALCVAVVMCAKHCSSSGDCGHCVNSHGNSYQGTCNNGICYCNHSKKRLADMCQSPADCGHLTHCPGEPVCGHGEHGDQNHKHCHC